MCIQMLLQGLLFVLAVAEITARITWPTPPDMQAEPKPNQGPPSASVTNHLPLGA